MRKKLEIQQEEKENRKKKILNCLQSGNKTRHQISKETKIHIGILYQDINTLLQAGVIEEKEVIGQTTYYGLSTGKTGGAPKDFKEYDKWYKKLPASFKSSGKFTFLYHKDRY